MHNGLNLGKRALLAAALAATLMATRAGAQTPIPTLPPLPPLPAAGETPAPAATATQPAAAPIAPTAAVTQPAAGPSTTPAPTRLPTERPAAPEASAGLPPSVLILLGIGVLVLVATLVVVLTVLLKKPVVINVPSRSGAPPPAPEGPAPAGWTDGGVVHAGQPPAGVLDVLPGRFLIDEGDRQTEIRIFRTGPGERVETTIGRDPGPPYRHIQLLPASVSGKHAKLVFDKRSYSLINYARTNPTRVNGEEIEENASRRLVDNDRIEIGEVVMTYRED
ncbi:MAG: FHA domain-containing protein [Acidobacteriota bacterium]